MDYWTIAARLAPLLIRAMNTKGGIREFPSLVNAIQNGEDPVLMQERLLSGNTGNSMPNIDKLEDLYVEPGVGTPFPSDWAKNSDLLNLAERKLQNPNIVMPDSPALESAANLYNNGLALGDVVVPPGQKFPGQGGAAIDPSGIGALYDEVARDYQNGNYDDALGYGLVDPYTTPNPATGMSEEDWDFDDVDDAADNPFARDALLKKIKKKRGK